MGKNTAADKALQEKIAQEKDTLRNEMKRLRRALAQTEQEAISAAVKEQIFSMPEFAKCQIFFTYLSYGKELCTHELPTQAIKAGKLVAAPKVTGDGRMVFYQVESLLDCAPGAFGILEPQGGRQLTPKMGDSFLLLPGLAFTRTGKRLGYGGGYYDRYAGAHPQAFLAAPSYPFAVLEDLPGEAHDIRADALVLAQEIVYVDKGTARGPAEHNVSMAI